MLIYHPKTYVLKSKAFQDYLDKLVENELRLMLTPAVAESDLGKILPPELQNIIMDMAGLEKAPSTEDIKKAKEAKGLDEKMQMNLLNLHKDFLLVCEDLIKLHSEFKKKPDDEKLCNSYSDVSKKYKELYQKLKPFAPLHSDLTACDIDREIACASGVDPVMMNYVEANKTLNELRQNPELLEMRGKIKGGLFASTLTTAAGGLENAAIRMSATVQQTGFAVAAASMARPRYRLAQVKKS